MIADCVNPIMTKPIRTAIIGTGFVGRLHLEALARLGSAAQVCALVTADLEQARNSWRRVWYPKYRIRLPYVARGHFYRCGAYCAKNIEEAASQLGYELNKTGSENGYGIVAISLSRVFTKGNLACFAPTGTGKRLIGEALAELLDEHTEQWGLKRFREMNPRIVAVMFHLAAPWDIGGERLIHLSTSNFLETGNNASGWKTLRKHVEELEQAVA